MALSEHVADSYRRRMSRFAITELKRPSAPPVATPDIRDRFLAFAFAAADLLVETALDGTIGFAAGAFRPHFGTDGDRFLYQRITTLIAPGDHAALAMALATVTLRGRIPPMALRLNDPARTPMAVAAMLMPGPPPRICFTLGPLPLSYASSRSAPDESLRDSKLFLREAEAMLRAGAEGTLGLLEIRGWHAAKLDLSAADTRMLRDGIGAVLTAAGPGTLASEIADGRYGLLAPAPLDLGPVIAGLEQLIGKSPAARLAGIAAVNLRLEPGDLAAPQAARALRYAVSRFAESGAEAVVASGAARGLSGVIAQASARARAVLETLTERRFRLAFQPVVSLADRSIHHYEALLRPIPTPGNHAHSTQDFVAFAEVAGLSEELDWAVLQEALAAQRAAPNTSIAVNISGLSMQSPAFRQRMLPALAASPNLTGPQGAGRLLIELTETAEIEDMPEAAAGIAQLRQIGVPVCIDDFGAGAAAFHYLREFRVDYVKIDGAFIRAATYGARERGFVAAMVEIARTVDARIVAEMIETEEQAALMGELGVSFGQGWLFGRPGALPGRRR
jgi:EAL domain-containing protein (putative c-di-GMP-specific phosphodiesterase class I)